MKRSSLIPLALIGALLILVAVGAGLVAYKTFPPRLATTLTTLCLEQTGQKLSLENTAFSLFPWIGIRFDNPEWRIGDTTSLPVATAEEIQLKLRVFPLLKGKIDVEQIDILGFDCDLEQTEAVVSTLKTAQNMAVSPAPFLASLQSIRILDGIAHGMIEQADGDNSWIVNPFTLTLFPTPDGQPLPFDLSLAATGEKGFSGHDAPVTVQATMHGDLRIDPNEARLVTVSGMQTTTTVSGDTIPGGSITGSASGLLHYAPLKRELYLAGIIDSCDVTGTGTFQLHWDGAGSSRVVECTSKTTFEPFNLRELLHRLNVPLPAMAGKETLESVAGTISLKTDSEQISIEADKLLVDGGTLEGILHIPADTSSQPVNLKLISTGVVFDRYLPPAGFGHVFSMPNKYPAASVQMDIEMQSSDLFGIHFTKSTVNASLKNSQLTINQQAPSFHGGTASMQTTVEYAGKTEPISYSISGELSKVRLHSMLASLEDENRLTGVCNATFAFSGQGKTRRELLGSLSGRSRSPFRMERW